MQSAGKMMNKLVARWQAEDATSSDSSQAPHPQASSSTRTDWISAAWNKVTPAWALAWKRLCSLQVLVLRQAETFFLIGQVRGVRDRVWNRKKAELTRMARALELTVAPEAEVRQKKKKSNKNLDPARFRKGKLLEPGEGYNAELAKTCDHMGLMMKGNDTKKWYLCPACRSRWERIELPLAIDQGIPSLEARARMTEEEHQEYQRQQGIRVAMSGAPPIEHKDVIVVETPPMMRPGYFRPPQVPADAPAPPKAASNLRSVPPPTPASLAAANPKAHSVAYRDAPPPPPRHTMAPSSASSNATEYHYISSSAPSAADAMSRSDSEHHQTLEMEEMVRADLTHAQQLREAHARRAEEQRLAEEHIRYIENNMRHSMEFRCCVAIFELGTQATPIPHDLKTYLNAHMDWPRLEAAFLVLIHSPGGHATMTPWQALHWMKDHGIGVDNLNLLAKDLVAQGVLQPAADRDVEEVN